MKPPAVYCADIGSVKKKNFGWARQMEGAGASSGSNIAELVDALAADITENRRVALGFECPLYVPIYDDPINLTSQRSIDGGRSWSAGAGAGALATGLTETVWILQRVRDRLLSPPPAFIRWDDFTASEAGLFLWEAMVTGKAKGASHEEDAAIAVCAFLEQTHGSGVADRYDQSSVQSLIGAALLRSGWSADLSLLAAPCLVIKA